MGIKTFLVRSYWSCEFIFCYTLCRSGCPLTFPKTAQGREFRLPKKYFAIKTISSKIDENNNVKRCTDLCIESYSEYVLLYYQLDWVSEGSKASLSYFILMAGDFCCAAKARPIVIAKRKPKLWLVSRGYIKTHPKRKTLHWGRECMWDSLIRAVAVSSEVDVCSLESILRLDDGLRWRHTT